ncbi:uncharacterized protein [Epargyreus clarus]|uniref:uncharacterized protein n=1 Tax=Epargyreus clarus TaxID=520877 RepID=UPI003C2E57C7
MLENNPMGSRRRRRFYHRCGVVPLPGDQINEFVEVPSGFFTNEEPGTSNDFYDPKIHTNVINISALFYRLLDIVNKMIALAEAKERNGKDEDDDTSESDDDQNKTDNDIDIDVEPDTDNEEEAEDENEVENEPETDMQTN